MKKVLLFSILGLLLTSCGISGVDADEEGVFVAKPWIFGGGGVYDTPLSEGTSITAVSTQVVRFKVTPMKYAEIFDDVMSDDNTPVDLQAYVILQIERGKTPILLTNYGESWYDNNVRETFRKYIRDRVSTYPMYDLTSNREACQKIEDETLTLLQAYFDRLNNGKELPVKILSVIVDRATPNKEVMEEINKTASQIQAKKTQTERESMEKARANAERERAKADKQYQSEMNLSADQFIQLRALEMELQKIEMVRGKDNVNVDVMFGNALNMWDIKK